MRALVAYGSKRQGTAEISAWIGEELALRGVETAVTAAASVRSLEGFDAVVLAGALYAGRWHKDARGLARRLAPALRARRVWLVSSGPLGDAAHKPDVPPVAQVAAIIANLGALGHVTFGGRLVPEPRGYVAKAMAKKLAGDWRDRDRVRQWAANLAVDLNRASS